MRPGSCFGFICLCFARSSIVQRPRLARVMVKVEPVDASVVRAPAALTPPLAMLPWIDITSFDKLINQQLLDDLFFYSKRLIQLQPG